MSNSPIEDAELVERIADPEPVEWVEEAFEALLVVEFCPPLGDVVTFNFEL